MTYKGYNILVQKAGNGKVAGFVREMNKQFTIMFAYFETFEDCVNGLELAIDTRQFEGGLIRK